MPEKARKIEQLRRIERLVSEARTIADGVDEHLIGAKLEDCLVCAQERMSTLNH